MLWTGWINIGLLNAGSRLFKKLFIPTPNTGLFKNILTDDSIRLILWVTDSSEKLSRVNLSKNILLNTVNKNIIRAVNKKNGLSFKKLILNFGFLYFLTIVVRK